MIHLNFSLTKWKPQLCGNTRLYWLDCSNGVVNHIVSIEISQFWIIISRCLTRFVISLGHLNGQYATDNAHNCDFLYNRIKNYEIMLLGYITRGVGTLKCIFKTPFNPSSYPTTPWRHVRGFPYACLFYLKKPPRFDKKIWNFHHLFALTAWLIA